MSLKPQEGSSVDLQDRGVADEQRHGSNASESFAETALKLGGKSAEEARRTGAIDTADDQVEDLFKPEYQTVNILLIVHSQETTSLAMAPLFKQKMR